MCMSHFAVQQRLAQHCKSTIIENNCFKKTWVRGKKRHLSLLEKKKQSQERFRMNMR